MPIVIEFLGHAGAGKSFLSKHLADVLGDDCVGTESFSMRTSNVALFMAKNPAKLILILRYVCFSRQINIRSFFKSLRRVLVYYVKLDMASRMNKRFIIIGEGALKVFNDIRTTSSIENLAYDELPQSIRKEIFRYADVVVFVFCSLRVAAGRLALRENLDVNERDIKEWLARIEGNFHLSFEDNQSNIRSAKVEHEFKLIEFENNSSCPIEPAIENLAEDIIRTSRAASS